MLDFLKKQYSDYLVTMNKDSSFFYFPLFFYTVIGAALYYSIVLQVKVNLLQFLFLSVICGPGAWLGCLYFTLGKMF